MAIFFQEQPEPGELAGTLSIEGLLPAWCQQRSTRTPKGDEHRTRLDERFNEEAMRHIAPPAEPACRRCKAQFVRPPFVRPRDP
jgi:hypothetical protein